MKLFESSENLNGIASVRHGFFTRYGGFSQKPFASLNGSFLVGDVRKLVEKNRTVVAQSLGGSACKLFVPRLVHKSGSLVIDQLSCPHRVANTTADALITQSKNILIAVTYADCVPVLMASQNGDVVAAVHAGWRGISKNIIGRTVTKLQKDFGATSIVAAIGPAISRHGFTVTGEVLSLFQTEWPDFVFKNEHGNSVDLRLIAEKQLMHAGVLRIEYVGGYTDRDHKKYFSHRRDNGLTGRHLAVICRSS